MVERTLEYVRDGIASGLHIGAQVYVAREGRMLLDVAIGEARPGVGMTSETQMLWQSASKPVTAVGLAVLKDRGLLDWDDAVVKFIPEFGQYGKEQVTVRHVLTHTAGLRAVHLEWPSATWDQTIAALCAARMEPRWELGQRAGYHPTSSWFLLGEIIRRVTGESWGWTLRKEVLGKLGMTQTLPAMTREEYAAAAGGMAPGLGILQRMKDGVATEMGLDTEECCVNPRSAGGMHGPVRELGMFYQGMLSNQTATGERLLQDQTLRELTTRQRVGLYDQTFRHVIDWGLGFIVNSAQYGEETLPYGFGPHASEGAFGHGGSQSSMGMADPQRGLAVAVVFNGCPGEAAHNKRNREFFKTLYEELGDG